MADRREQRPGAEGRQERRDQLREQRGDRRDNRTDGRDDRLDRRFERADRVRDHVARYPIRGEFWRNNPYWARWRWNRPYRWATWAALGNWFTWGGYSEPYYYDYGSNVYYDNGYVYADGEEVASADAYTDEAIALADQGADTLATAPDDTEWMSLGVFALANEEQGDPVMFMQLQVARDGTLAGTYHNTTSNNTLPVQGAVDKQTQRAVWTIGDKQDTVLETGIYNLTQDETPVLVHFGEKAQNWLMVRLDEPAEEQQGT